SHRSRKAAATLVVHPSDHPFDSDLVDMNDDGLIRAFRLKPRPPDCYCRNVGNAGVYVVSHTLADMIPRARCDFVRDIFPRALQEGMALYGYRTREYLRDIGTPERLTAIRTDWATRRVERRHRDVAMPAVFLDRDGTLCELVPLLHKAGDLRLVRGAAEAIRHLNRADYLAVVITNQPVVARGLCTLEQLDHIHARMETLLGEHGATLDGIYYCPHHPDAGYRGEVAQHKVACRCRKPGGGLVRRAVSDLNIDLSQSVFVGDSTVDVETGQRLGLRTILVQTGEAGRDGKFSSRPDAICADLPAAVDLILQAKTQNAFTTKTPRHKG
ncbi:HAD-IIIA family hydrolase, partial [Candidatus Sumerlaeota bacterium]|nr:HAD-IIIA family hydrolase [Candidatus Sumerlaeota bacterium]